MATISVIVPVYKVEPYLRRCIDSILVQTYTDFELILVDDGSPDNCGKICDEYAAKDNRIKVIHQENGGLSAARNAGIVWSLEHSRSQYISFIDSDDYIEQTYLEELYCGIRQGARIACMRCKYVTDTGSFSFGTLGKRWKLVSPEKFWLKTSALPQAAWGKLYDKSLFKTIRYPAGRLHEDEFTTHKILFGVDTIAVSNQHLYCYCLRSTGITGSTWSPKRMDSMDAYIEQCEFFKAKGLRRAYELARGRKLFQMLQAAKNLDAFNIDHDRAKALLAQVIEENKASRIPFWENRDFYRDFEPRLYKVKWLLAMLGNFLRHGYYSWLVQDGLGTIRQALYPPTE